jgi:hypothetical protein
MKELSCIITFPLLGWFPGLPCFEAMQAGYDLAVLAEPTLS